jgi:hypothetical protein
LARTAIRTALFVGRFALCLAVGFAALTIVFLIVHWLVSRWPLPRESPLGFVSDDVWQAAAKWVLNAGLAGSAGAASARGLYNWFTRRDINARIARGEIPPPQPEERARLTPGEIIRIVVVFTVLLGLLYTVYIVVPDPQLRVDPSRVCARDPSLPEPQRLKAAVLYDTDEDGTPDVARSPKGLLLVDPEQDGSWPEAGTCVRGLFSRLPSEE